MFHPYHKKIGKCPLNELTPLIQISVISHRLTTESGGSDLLARFTVSQMLPVGCHLMGVFKMTKTDGW